MNHRKFLSRCIQLAKNALGKTYPNPMVGAVILHKSKIIGEGWHPKSGEKHAEIIAIQSVKNPEFLSQSRIYVSLEPCSHFGKTPPCALKIKDEKFQEVIIGTLDKNPDVDGKGVSILENSRIRVTSGVLEHESLHLNRRFFTFHNKKRPFIILKWAESSDGFIDENFISKPIGNTLSQQFVHKLRSEEQAILVGTKTVLRDNPRLSTRTIFGRNPIRFIIDLSLKIPRDFHIYNDEAETYIINEKLEHEIGNIHFIKILRSDDFLDVLMKKLYALGIQSIIIEGGRFTLEKFLKKNLWDEIIKIKADHLTLKHGTKAPFLTNTAHKEQPLRNNTLYFYKNN